MRLRPWIMSGPALLASSIGPWCLPPLWFARCGSPNEEEEEEDVKTHRVLVRNLPVQAPEDLLLVWGLSGLTLRPLISNTLSLSQTIFHDDPVLEANVTIDEDRNVAMATLHFR